MHPRIWTLATLILALVSGCRDPVRSDEVASGGVLDLRHSDLPQETISLSGQWAFYPGILKIQELESVSPVLVSVPASWNEYPGFGGPEKSGIFRLRLLLPKDTGPLALRVEGIYSAWTLYADGKKIWKSGAPAPTVSEVEAGPRSALVFLPEHSSVVDLQIVVSNFHYREGGIRKPIRLGNARTLLDRERSAQAWDLFLAGAISIIGLYHIFLFAVRRQTHAPAFLGLHCLSIAIRPLTTGEEFLFHMFPELGWHFFLSLEYYSLPLSVFFFLVFLRYLFPDRWFGPGLVVVGITGLALLILPFLVSSLTLSKSVGFYQVHMLASGIFGLVMLIRSVVLRKPNSLPVLLGGIPLLLGVINDVLSARGDLNTIQFGSASLLAFVLLQSALLSVRYARSFRQVEDLSRELKSKNQDLEKLDELKNDFLANTSHELRTPLHGIIGITESVLQGATGKISEETRENLRLVAASGRRLTTLVNDILDFSRANHGDLEISPRELNVADSVDVALSLVRPLLRDKPVDLIHKRSEVPAVFADPERLNQILVNLLGNSIKFTSKGSIEIEAFQEGDFVRLLVRDTGIGIPENRQSAIFESFTQADGSISRKYSGTGLGLSITRHLVWLHGGDISVQSAPARGSEFSFTLPVFVGQIQESRVSDEPIRESMGLSDSMESYAVTPEIARDIQEAPREASLFRESSAVNTEKIRTLVVDDDPVNLQVLRNFLSVESHEILEASSGTEALTALQESGPVDLVLLDVMMPGLTGYEVCRILRQSHSAAELPIVLLTARSRTQDVVEGLASGANDYLAKPFEPEELRARVQNILELKQAARTQADMAVIQNELSMARMIQQSLIPASIPSPDGLKISHVYRSMVNVGGDYYDYSLEDGLSLIIADVSGHGVPAALVVSVLKMAYIFSGKEATDPARLLRGLNEMLFGNVGHEFVTACALQIDTANKRLWLANAGHPPVLHLQNKKGKVREYKPFGRPMGLFPESEFEGSEGIELASGDRLLLYTDGAFETSSPSGEQYGLPRLISALQESGDTDLDFWLNELMETLIEHSGGPSKLDDDIAMIAIEVD